MKLADRLHNMRTIEFMPTEESRLRISRETLDIYAPLARRVGLSIFAGELEDLAFKQVNPVAYSAITKRLEELVSDDSSVLDRIRSDLDTVMLARGVRGDLEGRMKRPYSIWRKLETKSISFKDLGDVFAFRLIVGTTEECYRALGAAHQQWAALSEKFKDYISVPKPNGYRSLHTTFLGPGNRRVELQIRTRDMEAVAERGVAAHWSYKNSQYGFDAEAAREAGLDRRSRTHRIRRYAEARRLARGIPRARQAADVPRQRVRLHAEGHARASASRRNAARLSPTPSTPRSATPPSARASTGRSARCAPSSKMATRSKSCAAHGPRPSRIGKASPSPAAPVPPSAASRASPNAASSSPSASA